MTIATVALSQEQSYQQTSTQSRKITRLSNVHTPENIDIASSTPSDQQHLSKMIQFTSTQNTVEQVTYEKPKDIKLQLMVLVLERVLGLTVEMSDFSFNSINSNAENKGLNNTLFAATLNNATAEFMKIDGQSFKATDLLSVEQWHYHEQQLDYQVQGSFKINEQELSLNFNLSLTSERSSYSKVEVTAAALKDPLLVQFGSQSLGNIKGEKSFAINQGSTLDLLPIFSGDVGYLVYDKNNNQYADNGNELFGPKTGQGFTELAQLDSNENGFIDAEDQAFEQLYLWQPSEENEQAEQWLSLKDAKIQAISLSAISTPFDFYNQLGEIQAQLRQSSFAISDEGYGRGVHQVDVRI